MRCAPVLAFLLLVLTEVFLAAAERDPSEHPYQWRVSSGRKQVLWLGGGHWHETLSTAATLRRVIERDGRFHVTYSEDCQVLTRLERYDVILLQAMLDSLSADEERGLLAAVRGGRPLLVLHAASASFRKPPSATRNDPPAEHAEFYAMLGGYCERHPPFGPIPVRVVAKDHPMAQGVGDFVIEDELFLFRNLQKDNHVLLEADFESQPRPLAWTRIYGKGQVLHIALGHGPKAAANPAFERLVVQGLDWLVVPAGE